MFDFPFKTYPKLSMGFGPGIASDHISFSKTFVGIKDNTSTIHFTNQADTNHFKKTKLPLFTWRPRLNFAILLTR